MRSPMSPISSRKIVPRCACSKRADLVPIGAGEAPLDVPEELGLEQRLGHAGAVERHEALGGSSGPAVNQAREHVLADTALAGDEHLHVARGDAGRDADRVFHRGTRADDYRVERIVIGDSVRIWSLQYPECLRRSLKRHRLEPAVGIDMARWTAAQFRHEMSKVPARAEVFRLAYRESLHAAACSYPTTRYAAACVCTDLIFRTCDGDPMRKS